MVDRQAVIDLINHGAIAYDTSDLDFLLEMYLDEDAELSLTVDSADSVFLRDKNSILKFFTDALEKRTALRRHVITNTYFEKETENTVTAISCIHLVGIDDGTVNILASGTYTYDCIEVGGKWKIKKREVTMVSAVSQRSELLRKAGLE